MAMRSEARVEAEVEEEENFGPQPLCRLEVCNHRIKLHLVIMILYLILHQTKYEV